MADAVDLADVSAALFAARNALTVFDTALIEAVGSEPGTDPGSRAAESTALLKEAIEDADRLSRSINDLLQQYRKGI